MVSQTAFPFDDPALVQEFVEVAMAGGKIEPLLDKGKTEDEACRATWSSLQTLVEARIALKMISGQEFARCMPQ